MLQQTYSIRRPHTLNTFEIHPLKKEEEDHRPVIKECFNIIWIREGAGALNVDLHAHAFAGDTVFCIKPGQVVDLEPHDEVDGYTISFSSDFLAITCDDREPSYYSALFHPLSPFSIVKVDAGLKAEMLTAVERMTGEFSNNYPGKEEILRGLLKIFLIYLNRHQAVQRQQLFYLNPSGLASRFFSLLEKNFVNRKLVSDYAHDLSVTPNYLNETVKKASGFSASYHIQQRIILEAKRKAAHVSKSMKEIAYDLGFDDISHFSKYFKKASGISFSTFKKEISRQFSLSAAC
jgi:AraC-like DNA-binding protein